MTVRSFRLNEKTVSIKNNEDCIFISLENFLRVFPEFSYKEYTIVDFQGGETARLFRSEDYFLLDIFNTQELNFYIDNIQELLDKFQQDTFLLTKKQIQYTIEGYASDVIDLLINKYSFLETSKWQSVLLKEAKDYLSTQDNSTCPNLIAQLKIAKNLKSSIINPSHLQQMAQKIIDKDIQLTKAINFYCGLRKQLSDKIENFIVKKGETQEQAIKRLQEFNWKEYWIKETVTFFNQ